MTADRAESRYNVGRKCPVEFHKTASISHPVRPQYPLVSFGWHSAEHWRSASPRETRSPDLWLWGSPERRSHLDFSTHGGSRNPDANKLLFIVEDTQRKAIFMFIVIPSRRSLMIHPHLRGSDRGPGQPRPHHDGELRCRLGCCLAQLFMAGDPDQTGQVHLKLSVTAPLVLFSGNKHQAQRACHALSFVYRHISR
jgi:hypothetical protein